SFVFSFGNDQDMYNMKIGRVTNIACSIYDSPFYDCFFNFGNMLYVTNGQRLAVGYDNRYYRNIFGEKHLSNIEEIEVFSVSGKDC
ncbi:14211_t:CDS:1, partial [Rhizophagus irregularis]